VNIYRAAFAAGFGRAVRQPGDLAVRAGFYLLLLLTFAALWNAATAAQGGDIEGYTFAALVWYVVAAEGAVNATKPRLIEEIGDAIGSGLIAVEMLRPVSVVGFRLAAETGEALARVLAVVVPGAVVVLLAEGPPPPSAGALLAVPSLVLAFGCNLAGQHVFAASAFWVNDAKATWFLYQKFVFLLGGMLLPLEFLPGGLEFWARTLPFWTMAYAPARLLSGRAEPMLLLGQVVWLVALVAAALAVFGAGERRLQVAGG